MKSGKDYIGLGVGAIIQNEKNEILLLKRPDTITPDRTTSGMWSVPGGEVEFMEGVEDAIKREVKEEIGIDVEIIKINETDEPSSVLLPRIKAEREAKIAESKVAVLGISNEWYVTKKGIDVTREFITAPPKRGRTFPKIPSKERSIYPKAVRETVWRKYFGNKMNGKCYVCGKPIYFTDFEVGHNKARAKGGTSNINNLRPICRTCNRSMGTMNIETFKRRYFS